MYVPLGAANIAEVVWEWLSRAARPAYLDADWAYKYQKGCDTPGWSTLSKGSLAGVRFGGGGGDVGGDVGGVVGGDVQAVSAGAAVGGGRVEREPLRLYGASEAGLLPIGHMASQGKP